MSAINWSENEERLLKMIASMEIRLNTLEQYMPELEELAAVKEECVCSETSSRNCPIHSKS